MNKKLIILALAAAFAMPATAQSYRLTFLPQTPKGERYYLAQHFRDKFNLLDSVEIGKNGNTEKQFVFSGSNNLDRGVYTLLDSQKKKLFDFMVDDSRKFSIAFDEKCSNAGMTVKGSNANTVMYAYMAKMDWANGRAKELGELKTKDREKYNEEMKSISDEMTKYQDDYMKQYAKYRFTQLISMSQNAKVPDELPANAKETKLQDWQAIYYRTHYWDNMDLTDHSLIYTPHLFDRMNYYFFGVLYYQESDTITRYADMVLHKVENDSTMLRYFLDFIAPKYQRATKNIGWDQVYVNLVQNYYPQGKCPWATEADLYSKHNEIQFLGQSLIGAIGQELFMADSNQSDNPKDWISSHRFPQRYVILWFWDPDCHHCQEQSEALAHLYDSLSSTGNKPFEVYAVGYEADVAKWKRYIRTHNFPFVNVGGSNVNIDYQEAYNIHGAPTMIILDADRRIIMNKTLPASGILPFLERYEKEHPEMATKVTHWMTSTKK